MTIPEELRDVLDSNPEIISGAIRFKGTRVPLQALLQTLEDGDTVHDFLSVYPGALSEQAEAVVRWVRNEAPPGLVSELAA